MHDRAGGGPTLHRWANVGAWHLGDTRRRSSREPGPGARVAADVERPTGVYDPQDAPRRPTAARGHSCWWPACAEASKAGLNPRALSTGTIRVESPRDRVETDPPLSGAVIARKLEPCFAPCWYRSPLA